MTKQNSVTEKIYDSFKSKLGERIATIGVLKVLAIASAQLPFPRLNIIHSAPSGHFKTLTSTLASQFFPSSCIMDLKSDFTIHSLYNKAKGHDGKAKINNKCLLINDGTLLFSSKSERTKQRLINGLAELMTDGKYEYADFQRAFWIKGKITTIINITTKSYTRNLDQLFGNTFDERCLTVHLELSPSEFDAVNYSSLFRSPIYNTGWLISRWKVDHEITIPPRFEDRIRLDSAEFSWKSVKGYSRSKSIIKAIISANCMVNNRRETREEDFWIVDKAKDYLINPLQPNKPRIVQMLRNKQSIADICKALNMDYETYNPYVYKVLRESKERGLLS